MKKLPLAALNRLNHNLDFFTSATPDPDLIREDLYLPLPVSGNHLIWGFPILRTAARLQLPALWCRQLPEMDKPAMAVLALKLENRPGRYTWDEKEKLIQYLLPDQLPIPEFSLLLEGKAIPDLRQRYAAYSSLPVAMKTMVRSGFINLKTAVETGELPQAAVELFAGHPAAAGMTFSERRILLTGFYEIYKRDSLSGAQALDLLGELLAEKNPVAALKKLRYPQLTGLETEFNNFKNCYLKDCRIELQPPPDFEGNTFTVSFNFTAGNLGKKIHCLQQIREHIDELENLL